MSTSDILLVFVFDNKKDIYTHDSQNSNTTVYDRENVKRDPNLFLNREGRKRRDSKEMGNLCSNEIRTEEEDIASRDIERQLKEDEEKFKKISRLLLLGKFDFFFSLRRQRHERFCF